MKGTGWGRNIPSYLEGKEMPRQSFNFSSQVTMTRLRLE